eukprot:TRINITY_DN7194_c0_g2_i1.p1 TRINITY_DN7194_c0_g2~~TRINITY_DN7194_c0_g2_i1.p1  ORF type:complete len:169 (+),score=21.25 TRINITY_DN7194_c0_g2_i1:73-507(+)
MRVLGACVCLAAAAAADFATSEYTVDLDKSAYDWAPVANDAISKRECQYTFLENVLPHTDWVCSEPLWYEVLASYPQCLPGGDSCLQAVDQHRGTRSGPWGSWPTSSSFTMSRTPASASWLAQSSTRSIENRRSRLSHALLRGT